MESKSLGAMLRGTAGRVPNKAAFLVPGKEKFTPVTYTELLVTVRRYAAVLAEQGLVKGDRVCILSENCVEWSYADWAIQTLGLVLVPIYPTLPADQVQYIVKDCEAKLVLAGSTEQANKTGDAPTLMLKGSANSMQELAEATEPMPEGQWNSAIDAVGPEELATIIYTSGTTGLPKGAMLPNRAIMHVCWSAARNIHFQESDTFLCFLPMSHVYERVAGQALPIYLGATIAYAKSLASLAIN